MSTPSCPRCGTEVGATWRWCLACGYDPDGTHRHVRDAHVEAHLKKGAWTPVVVVLIGMFIGAAILWRTAPGDEDGTRASPTTTEIRSWAPFTAPDDSFRADFPGPPHADSAASADGSPVVTYLALVNQQLFGVSITDTGRGELDDGVSEDVATATLSSFVTAETRVSGGTVSSSTATRTSTAPALDYVVTGSPLGETHGRAVLVGRQIFNIVVSGARPREVDVDRFVDSFSLG